MDSFYNHILYVVPKDKEMFFRVLPNSRDVSIKLLDGDAEMYVKYKQIPILLQQEIPIHDWQCSCYNLKTKSGCTFLVRENHYAAFETQPGQAHPLFVISPSENSYSFVLEKNIQLQIFPVESAGQESSITISSSRGATEIYGFKLSHETNYHLAPFSPVLLKSFDEEPYSVYVKGLDRKVKLFIRDENHHECVNNAKDRIFASHLPTIQLTQNSPIILVLGPKNAGKTSFCQLLLNETLEKKMSPIYVDLNVKRNSSIPGSLSLSEIDGRIDNTLDFKYNIQKLLHYGSLSFGSYEVRYYYYLLRKMGELLTFYLNNNSKENRLSIIDTDGSHGENNTSIELILNSFAVDLVIYIGDKHYYENLKHSLLKNVPSEFISKPPNAEQPCNSYEARYFQYRIQKYFFRSTNPSTQNACIVPFCDVTVYQISTKLNDTNSRDGNDCDIIFDRAYFNQAMSLTMLNCLFAVSAADGVQLQERIQVKYYVYFTAINMAAKIATVMVPISEIFNGGILLLGFVSTHEHDPKI